MIIVIYNILRGGLQSPEGGFQEGPEWKIYCCVFTLSLKT